MAEFEKGIAEDDIADKAEKEKKAPTARSPAPDSSSKPRLELDLEHSSDADIELDLPPHSTQVYQTEAPSVMPEYLRRDQRSIIYKPVPSKVTEIDMFFYDAHGKIIHSIISLKRDSNGLRYRTLPKSKSHLWPLVKRIRVFSANPDYVDDNDDVLLVDDIFNNTQQQHTIPSSEHFSFFSSG